MPIESSQTCIIQHYKGNAAVNHCSVALKNPFSLYLHYLRTYRRTISRELRYCGSTSECKLLLLWDDSIDILSCCGIIRAHREVVLRSPGRMRNIAYLLLKRVVGKRQQNSRSGTMLYDGWAIFTC